MTMKKVKSVAKAEARKAVKGHEASMHGPKKMRAGGKTNIDMKKMGRNLAKVANQKAPIRNVRKMGI